MAGENLRAAECLILIKTLGNERVNLRVLVDSRRTRAR